MVKQLKSLPRYIPAAYELISLSVEVFPLDTNKYRFLNYSYNDLMAAQDKFASEYGLPFTANQAFKKFIIRDANNDRRTWYTFALDYLKFSFKDLKGFRFKHLLVFRNLLIDVCDIVEKGAAIMNNTTSYTYLINTSPKK